MKYAQLKAKFPYASESFLRRNSDENKTNPQISHTELCQRSDALASGGEGKTQSGRLPHVCFTLCRHKLLDVDAKHGSCKNLLDGVVKAFGLVGDKEGEITLEVKQQKVAQSEEELTIIEIDLP